MTSTTLAAYRVRITALLLGVACAVSVSGARSEQPSEEPSPAGAAAAQTLQQQWVEAVEALKRYSAVQRDQALSKGEQMLNAMDARIEQLEARASNEWGQLSEKVRQRREAALRSLKRERHELAEWYGGMKHSSADAWENVKRGFIEAYGALSESLSKTRDEFDNKGSI